MYRQSITLLIRQLYAFLVAGCHFFLCKYLLRSYPIEIHFSIILHYPAKFWRDNNFLTYIYTRRYLLHLYISFFYQSHFSFAYYHTLQYLPPSTTFSFKINNMPCHCSKSHKSQISKNAAQSTVKSQCRCVSGKNDTQTGTKSSCGSSSDDHGKRCKCGTGCGCPGCNTTKL